MNDFKLVNMVKAAAGRIIKWLNMFPPKGGVSMHYSPQAIVTNKPLDYNQNCKYAFGSYVQALQENTPTNSPAAQTLDCIFLDSDESPAGGYKLLHLDTNWIITCRKITPVPLTQNVINRVEYLAHKEGLPNKLQFILQKNGKLSRNDDDDALLAGVEQNKNENKNENIYEKENQNEYESQDKYSNENDDEINDVEYDNHDNNSINSHELRDLRKEIEGEVNNSRSDNNDNQNDNQSINPDIKDVQDGTNHGDELEEVQQEEFTRPTRTRKKNPIMNIGSTKQQTYDTNVNLLIKQVEPNLNNTDHDATVLATIMINLVQTYSLRAGIKKFGNNGKNAALLEMEQLHKCDCWKPRKIEELSTSQKRNALESLLFLTEKPDGRVKARHCANGSKQCDWMQKEETASLTVMLQSVFLTCGIDAHEGHDVAIVDIPNAFIQTDHSGEMVIMKIKGELAQILVEVCPELYKDYVAYKNGIPIIYVELLKALYGLLESSFLFYKKLSKDLRDDGFIINPYDPCVANKIVEGKQLTVTWHVDDLKVSHVKTKVVDEFINWAQHKYEDVTKIKPSHGKKHDYLAMIIDYSKKGKVKICMCDYIEKMIEEFPRKDELGNAGSLLLASAHLFKINPACTKLNEEYKEIFHSTVARGLFVCCQARQDICQAIAFLSTRVKDPDEDDWKKLLKLLRYLRSTKSLCLTIEASNILNPKWWANAAFAVHPDMKSHTGGILMMGRGALHSVSRKQKLNTKSSKEAELVVADDILSDLLWTQNFLKEQGYTSKSTVLLQDNNKCNCIREEWTRQCGKAIPTH